jgi:hypothetical protein
VDWFYPLILTIVSVCVLFGAREFGHVSLYADGGFVAKILGFVQGLPGFYIAALAAIATFNRVDIDKTMPFPAPTLDITVQGRTVAIELTRRRFLCSMFAFLTAENLILIVFGIFGQSLYVPVKNFSPTVFHWGLSFTYLSIYLMLFWQMMITSFWGLFYLGDKLHQPDA